VLVGHHRRRAAVQATRLLAACCRATPTAGFQAQCATKRLLLPRRVHRLYLETALDSQLPGMTTCITHGHLWCRWFRWSLLERGSNWLAKHGVRLAWDKARVFVLWTEARAPPV